MSHPTPRFSSLLRHVLLVLALVIPAAAGAQPPTIGPEQPIGSADWYVEHPRERAEMMERCQAAPSTTVPCHSARLADWVMRVRTARIRIAEENRANEAELARLTEDIKAADAAGDVTKLRDVREQLLALRSRAQTLMVRFDKEIGTIMDEWPALEAQTRALNAGTR